MTFDLITGYSLLLDDVATCGHNDNYAKCILLATKLGRDFATDLAERKAWVEDCKRSMCNEK